MKTILVDAINALVLKEEGLFMAMYNLLQEYSNDKIILTGANDEQMEKFGLNQMPYPVFTLKHDPEKTDPLYYRKMLESFSLTSDDVVYFEHDEDAVKSAESVGIKTFHYDKDKKDLIALKGFLDNNLCNSMKLKDLNDISFDIYSIGGSFDGKTSYINPEKAIIIDKEMRRDSLAIKVIDDNENEGIFYIRSVNSDINSNETIQKIFMSNKLLKLPLLSFPNLDLDYFSDIIH